MTIPAEFDDIRPYTPEELPEVFEELYKDPHFQSVINYAFPDITFDMFKAKTRQCKSLQDFQVAFAYPFLERLIKNHTDGTDMDAGCLDTRDNYTFVSNHRDIVLDSALLSLLLLKNHFPTTAEIAIGDNLLIFPWIKKLVRINKSFIVKRSLTLRQQLESSRQLSRYMHFAIREKKENIWIAQREGRAKDSSDHTQDSILKMMALGGEGTLCERLKSLHIAPLSISYEFDPCDFLKAKEFQQKRDISDFKKDSKDDLINMKTGIFGYKGHVHYQAAPCINPWLDSLDRNGNKSEIIAKIAAHIDHEIHSNYRMFANNYIAADCLTENERFVALYTKEEKARFDDYIHTQIKRIDLPHPDTAFLERQMLTMYANPLFNYLKAAEKKAQS